MKTVKKQIDDLNLQVTIEVAAEDYAEIERKKLAERRRTAEFKGFRKGNVPASLIKKVYGEQALADSVNEVLGEALDEFIKKNKLNILGEPLTSEKQPEITWEDGQSFKFVFDLGLSPEINIDADKTDEVVSYQVTVAAKDKEEMAKNLEKFYKEQKKEKTAEEIDKEVTERLESNLKQEAEWRMTKEIREHFINKAGISLPEEFLKRWLYFANGGKVSKEDIEKEFSGFVQDFKWQLVRGYFMKKYNFSISRKDLEDAADAYVAYQYAMYGIGGVSKEIIHQAAQEMLSDRKEISRIEEQVEEQKVLEKLRDSITIKPKKITMAKFRELK